MTGGERPAREPAVRAAGLPRYPEALTIIACDDEGVQRKILNKLILPRLSADAASVVVGQNLEEIQSVVELAVSRKADMVILDQNLMHGGTLGTDVADELRAAGFSGFIVLRTGSSAEQLHIFSERPAIDLALDKGGKNLDLIAAIKEAYVGVVRSPRASTGY